jgi:hypothetical protein
MNETLKKFKTDLNRFTFENAAFISTLKKKTKVKHSKYRNNSIFCKVNDLNKLNRLKNLIENDNETGGTSKSNLKNQKTDCLTHKITDPNSKRSSTSISKEKHATELKRPISLELHVEPSETIDLLPAVKLTWDLVKRSEQSEQSQADIKAYEVFSYKANKNNDSESNKPSWILVIEKFIYILLNTLL